MRTNNMIEWTNREIRLGAPRGGDIPGWEFRPDAGLRQTSPRGGHPVGQQEIHEYEASEGGSGRRLYCWLISSSRGLQTLLRINLTAPSLLAPFIDSYRDTFDFFDKPMRRFCDSPPK